MREEPSLQAIDFAGLSALSNQLDAEKPYVELIDGLEVRKMSPKRRHAALQFELTRILKDWGAGRGQANLEWRCWIVPSGDQRTSLVPDVAWVSGERFALLEGEARETPPFAPDVAIEIRSPGDRVHNLRRKIDLYLAHGSRLVLDVDPEARTIVAHDASGSRTVAEGDMFDHPALPGLRLDVRALFAAMDS